MNRTFVFRWFLITVSVLFVVSAFSQSKARIYIKKDQGGQVTEETREFLLSEGQNIDDILKKIGVIDELGQLKDGQQFSISIEKNSNGSDTQNFDMFISPQGPGAVLPPFSPFGMMQPRSSEKRAFLGVMLKEESVALSKKKTQTGAYITEVVADSPASKAGLQEGDIILKMNDETVASIQDVITAVQSHQPGDEIKITYLKGGKKKKTLKVNLGQKPGESSGFYVAPQQMIPSEPMPPNMGEIEGMMRQFNFQINPDSILILSPGDSMVIGQPFCWNKEGMCLNETAFLGVTPINDVPETGGVKVDVVEESAAEKMGLLYGDILLEYNNVKISDFNSLAAMVQKTKPGENITIRFSRDGKEKEVTGEIGKRACSENNDFRIFHDYKGLDEDGSYNYNYEFDMDNDDIEQKMQDLMDELQGQQDRIQSQRDELQDQLDRLRENKQTIQVNIEIEEISAEEAARINENASPKLETTNNLALDKIVFFPNPNDGVINLNFTPSQSGDITVIVFDSNGGKIYLEELKGFSGPYSNTIDISEQASGTYYLQIMQNGKSYSKKIVKGQ